MECHYYKNIEFFAGTIFGLTAGYIFGSFSKDNLYTLLLVKLRNILPNDPLTRDFCDLKNCGTEFACMKETSVQSSGSETSHSEHEINPPTSDCEAFAEMNDMFDDIAKNRALQSKSVLLRGIEVGEEPIISNTCKGGYLTNADLDEVKNKRDSFKRLTNKEEINIIGEFSNIENMPYHEALKLVGNEGYDLFVNSVGDIIKSRWIYNGCTIGVEIIDPDYDYINSEPSKKARISEILNVGGLMKS